MDATRITINGLNKIDHYSEDVDQIMANLASAEDLVEELLSTLDDVVESFNNLPEDIRGTGDIATPLVNRTAVYSFTEFVENKLKGAGGMLSGIYEVIDMLYAIDMPEGTRVTLTIET